MLSYAKLKQCSRGAWNMQTELTLDFSVSTAELGVGRRMLSGATVNPTSGRTSPFVKVVHDEVGHAFPLGIPMAPLHTRPMARE